MTRLGITPQWGGVVIAQLLPDFMKHYPNAVLSLTENTAHPLLEAITENSLDMALVTLNEDIPSQFPNIPIKREELVLAVPVAYAEAALKASRNSFYFQGSVYPPDNVSNTDGSSLVSVVPDVFRDRPFILSKERTIIRDISNNLFRSANFVPQVSCEINNHAAQLQMVAAGIGIAIIPKCYIQHDGRIWYFSIFPGWYWAVSVITRRDYTLSQSDDYLISLLKTYYA